MAVQTRTKATMLKILHAIEGGCATYGAAAEMVGIAPARISELKKRHPEFAASCDQAMMDAKLARTQGKLPPTAAELEGIATERQMLVDCLGILNRTPWANVKPEPKEQRDVWLEADLATRPRKKRRGGSAAVPSFADPVRADASEAAEEAVLSEMLSETTGAVEWAVVDEAAEMAADSDDFSVSQIAGNETADELSDEIDAHASVSEPVEQSETVSRETDSARDAWLKAMLQFADEQIAILSRTWTEKQHQWWADR